MDFKIGDRLNLKDAAGKPFFGTVIKPTKYHHDMGKDGKSFVSVKVDNGPTIVQHVTPHWPTKA